MGSMLYILLLLFGSVIVNSELPGLDFDIGDIENEWNITNVDIRRICNQIGRRNISQNCINQMNIVCSNRRILLRMYDASSKFPYPGVAYNSRFDLGNFDQCMTINHFQNGTRVLGKHCAPGFVIPTTLDASNFLLSAFKFSICMPDACSNLDLVNALGLPNILLPFFPENFCVTVESGKYWTDGDLVILSLFVMFGIIMIISTAYDIYIFKKQIKSKHILLTAFSCFSNGRKLLQTSDGSNKEQVLVFHGIKVISMMWIVAGHGFAVWAVLPITNEQDSQTWQYETRYAQYIMSAHLGVDTFFFISGFLLAYMYFKQEPKPASVQIKSLPALYFHRYIRLTPALLMLFLFTIGIMQHIGTGPLYPALYEIQAQPCRTYWWSVFLYIQNYYNPDDFCLVPLWYVSADMQLFVLAPIVFIPIAMIIKKRFKLALMVLCFLNILFTILPLIAKLYTDYVNDYDTHSRFVDYFIGFMLGIYMRERKNKPYPLKAGTNVLTWIVILVAMFLIFMGKHEMEMNQEYYGKSIYFSLMRPFWCIGLSWIVYSCHKGKGGFVNWILCHPVFQVGSKLTYSMYLVHTTVIFYFYMSTARTSRYFNDFIVFYDWCGHFTITLLISIFWTLAFESPLIIIEKYLFGGNKDRKPLPDKKNIEEPQVYNNVGYKKDSEI